jgi:hypothetical protein
MIDITNLLTLLGSQEISVSIMTGYGLDGGGIGVLIPVWARLFSSPHHPDRFSGPFSLLSNEYGGGSLRGVKAAML